MEVFVGKETEDNWSSREKLCKALLREIECQTSTEQKDRQLALLQQIKPYYYALLDVCHSARTQLALAAIKFVGALACHANEYLDHFLDASLTTLIRLCSAAKKLIASAAEDALLKILYVTPPPKIFTHLGGALSDKNVKLRQRMTRVLLITLERAPGKVQRRLWLDMEPLLLRALGDASAAVRSDAIRILHIFEEKDEFAVEVKTMLKSKLDYTTAKQVKQAFANSKLGPVEGPHRQSQGSLEADTDYRVDSDSDGEIIIPMQKIRLKSEEMVDGIDDSLGLEKSPHRRATPPTIGTSRIPVKKPSPFCDRRGELKLCTPFRNRIVALQGPSTPVARLTTTQLLSQLSEETGLRQASLWKRLEVLANSSPASLPVASIERLFALAYENKGQLEGADLLGLVGMTVKQLLSSLGEALEFGETLIKLILWLSCHYRLYAEPYIKDAGHPCTWIKWDEVRLGALIKFITVNPATTQDALSMLVFLIECNSLNDCLSSVLGPLYQFWTSKTSQVSPDTSRLIVKCLTCARLRTGEAVFFQTLPSLTPAQRNLLNAYLTMYSVFRR